MYDMASYFVEGSDKRTVFIAANEKVVDAPRLEDEEAHMRIVRGLHTRKARGARFPKVLPLILIVSHRMKILAATLMAEGVNEAPRIYTSENSAEN